ncbi:MAG: cytochrome c oxidase subunit II [Phycisphaerae bacterium]|nr:cytochrome c oxidase subunit II [Phycisphaerae bacterium]
MLPERAAEGAREVDAVFLSLIAMALFFVLLVGLLILRFSIKYRAGSRADRSGRVQKTWRWEVTWTIIPGLIGLAIFIWSGWVFFDVTQPPRNARTIYVVGKQWMWKIQHPDGPEEINELHLARGQPVKLLLRSQDVIHSFYIPAFRVKQDALPGRYTSMWFTPNKTGAFHLFCAEYCGTEHSQMRGTVYVMEPEAFQLWRSSASPKDKAPNMPGTPGAPLAITGQGTFFDFGCNACHTPSARVIAPQLDGLFGQQIRLRDGSLITADEQYIRESILDPNAKIAAGYAYPSLMPTYKGQISESEMRDLIQFIQDLRDGWPGKGETP